MALLCGPRHLLMLLGSTVFALGLLYEFVLLGHGIGAIALFRMRRWAWNLLIGALLMQILLALIAVFRFSFVSPPAPTTIEVDGACHIISMWPSYVRAVLNTLVVSLLLTPKVRAHIGNMDSKTCHNHREPFPG